MPRSLPLFRQPLSAALLTALAACAGAGDARNTVTVDTLPGGIPRVMSSSPLQPGRWSLVALHDVQPPAGDTAELLNPQSIALAADGSLAVGEQTPAHVKIYGPDGRFLRRFGREGSGPGKFQSPFVAVSGDTIVIQDPRNSRATMMNWRTGEFIASSVTSCCYFAPVEIDGSGRAVVSSTASPPQQTDANVRAFVRVNLDGSGSDTVFVYERPSPAGVSPWLVKEGESIRMAVTVPLQPRAWFAIDPAGAFVTGWSGTYELRHTSDGRDTVRLFGREFESETVSDVEKEAIVEYQITTRVSTQDFPREADLRAAFDPKAIPSVRPPYENFWLDDQGRTWVRLSLRDTSTAKLDVFDREGRWLDQISLSAGDWPRSPWQSVSAAGGRMAVLLETEDGRPFVRVYRVRTDGSP